MPELPEVETLKRGLEKEAVGRKILSVEIVNQKVLKGQSEVEFRDRAVGKCIVGADRRGKYLFLPLAVNCLSSPSFTLCLHLNMRGCLRLVTEEAPLEKYGVLRLVLEEGKALHFEDMWGWGECRVAVTGESLPKLGEEPLEPDWDRGEFARLLSTRRVAIKTVLLDQKIVAGVGNIYADEALFRAQLAPTRVAATLTVSERERLAESIWQTLTEAVAQGGTRGDYVDLYGQAGRYLPQVYDREGAACPRCTAPLKKIKLGGRGTTFCPVCQN
ncbi:bifunctional DNA-formamidopyrimidine glycosylase/DNA-(apurinic or apyrimidinic site) lyase [Armatimonas sp.]|uniref:bifunctional DNA-formamidopyrimidine glycosylase/DNA-(apurinic or apyrimidinic site) lyase n=1 Tax=Armatimonas sp. TaxID=1872638 RepID=UPI00286ADB0C|nr:bifunctional DNA-formamidopyrimidine glycosylase/DNA-(apurinic or apyrimidinic site) lyase [Armatimonas sp.]